MNDNQSPLQIIVDPKLALDIAKMLCTIATSGRANTANISVPIVSLLPGYNTEFGRLDLEVNCIPLAQLAEGIGQDPRQIQDLILVDRAGVLDDTKVTKQEVIFENEEEVE